MASDASAVSLRRLNESNMTARHKTLYATLVAGHLFDGYDINMIGFILPGVIAAFHLSRPQAGFLASCVFIGMLTGSVLVGPIADRIGRKRALLLAIATYCLFSFGAGLTRSYDSLIARRILQGVGLGAEIPMVFTYLSEYMPARSRGALLLFGALAALFSFGAGGPLFTYTSEIYPTLLRGTGTGAGAAWVRVAGLVAPSVLAFMMGAKVPTYSLFVLNAGLMLVGCLAALLLVHETRSKSLEQISAELRAPA